MATLAKHWQSLTDPTPPPAACLPASARLADISRRSRSPLSLSPPRGSLPACLPARLQKEQGGGPQAEEEVPEWEVYRQQQQKEKKFKFKKGKGKKGAEEEEEVRWRLAWLPAW